MPSSEEISAANFGSGVQKPRRNKFKGKRAIRACDTCRRLKTRCILSPVPNEFYCLRCESLKIRCSFQDMLGHSNDHLTSLDGSESSLSKNVSHGSNELHQMDNNALKMLIKHGYGPQDAEITSKLLHSINSNVVKVLDILQNGNGATISNNASSARDRDPSAAANGFVNSSLLEAVKMASSISAPVERSNPSFDESPEPSPDLSSSLFTTEQRHISPYLTSPYTLLSQMVSKENLPIPIRKLHDHSFQIYQSEPVDDIITMNLITLEEAICLIGDFRDRYGAWCSFSASLSTEQLVSDIRSKDSSLLVTTTCVLALRYTEDHHDLKTRVYKNLLYKLKSDLELALKIMPQSTEFLQAIVILSLYASSFSSDIMSLDAWYISGIGLQQYLTANVQDALLASLHMRSHSRSNSSGKNSNNAESPFFFGLRNDFNDHQDLNPLAASSLFDENNEIKNFMSFRLWNHLCLVHVTHCVYSGRMCVIDEVRLDLSRRILQLPNATNFDGRMVGEIALQLILYNFMQKCSEGPASSSNSVNALENVKDDLHEWLEEWNYLFTQPITQFLEFAYHYGYTMVLYTWHHRLYRISQRNHDNQREKKSRIEKVQQQSEKTFIGTYLNHLYPIDSIIKSMPSEKQLELLKHSHKALRGIIKTEYAKFKYLSDQLFFSSVLSALICIAASYNLALENKNMNNVDEILIDVKTLSLRLQQIRNGELKSFWVEEVDLKIPSVILQYHKAIESYLQEKFPAFEFNPDE